MAKFKRIILLINERLFVHRAMYRGAQRYVHLTDNKWDFLHLGEEQTTDALENLSRGDLDGALGCLRSHEEDLSHIRWPFPYVEMDYGKPRMEIAMVGLDEHAIGRMAGEHFWQLGFRHFACFDHLDGDVGVLARNEGFQTFLSEQDCQAHLYKEEEGFLGDTDNPGPMDRWLVELPKPVGLFAGMDAGASRTRMRCRHMGLDVPGQVAILGVDDDELICEESHPPLSSIALACDVIGYEAARILDDVMSGKPPPSKPILIPPKSVHVRQSTDVVAIDDPQVAHAVKFIRENACRNITLDNILDQTSISQSQLIRKFQQFLKRTPFQEVRRVRIERAKTLLTETDKTIEEIGITCGFNDGFHLSKEFKKATNLPPGAYRKQFLRT